MTSKPYTRRLRMNSAINLAGQIAPLAAGLAAMPVLVHALGPERFGVLAMGWVLVGYFSLFDLGLGRTLTRFASRAIGEGRAEEVPAIVKPILKIMLVLGIFGGAAVLLGTHWLVGDLLKLPTGLKSEARAAFVVLALGIPIVIFNAALTGVLEAHQRFGLINAIRVPMSLVIFLGPVMVLPWTTHLAALTATIVGGRLAGLIATWWACDRIMPHFVSARADPTFRIGPFLRFGGWLTVSNIVGPIMLYADRFFVGALVSAAAVAYYTVPFEIVTRALIIPSAILGVMFAAFAEIGAKDPSGAQRLYWHTLALNCSVMAPLVLVVCLFAEPALAWWLSQEYADRSSSIAVVLMLGVFANSMGLISQAYVQSSGRPDLTAKLHLVEAPLYVSYLYLLLTHFGILGAAFAWLIRVSLSAAALATIAHFISPRHSNLDA